MKELLTAPGNPLGLSDIASVWNTRARIAVRPAGAGAQLLLLTSLARAGLTLADLQVCQPPCPTGQDIAQAIRAGRADCGIATRSAAQPMGLGFLPLAWEHFDLVLRQRDYFMPGPQALFTFLRGRTFTDRAAKLGGYDVTASGIVRHVSQAARFADLTSGPALKNAAHPAMTGPPERWPSG